LKNNKLKNKYHPMGVVEGCPGYIDAGTPASMAIVANAFNSDHPNYVLPYTLQSS
jgi:hypothetical protein